MTEKIVSAFHLVLSEQPNEDTEINKCKSAIDRVRALEKDVETACAIGKSSVSYLCPIFLASVYYKVLKLCRDS